MLNKSIRAARKISDIKHFYKCVFNNGNIDINAPPANDELKNPKISLYSSVQKFVLWDT